MRACFSFLLALFVAANAFQIQRSLTSRSPLVLSRISSRYQRIDNAHKLQYSSSRLKSVAIANAISTASSSQQINQASINALAKLISTCGIGIAAGKFNVINKVSLGVLSKLVFGLLQPCLLFCNVASTVSKLSGKNSDIIKILPAMALFQIIGGFLSGKIVSQLFFNNKNEENEGLVKQVQMCTTFGNSGPMPMVFVDAIFKNIADPSLLNTCNGYISLYQLGWSPFFWMIGPMILAEKGSGVDNKSMLLKGLMSPPVVASALGAVVGSIPVLRQLFVNSNGLLNPLFEAMKTLGAGYLPIALLVLAGSLSSSGDSDKSSATENKGTNTISFAKQIAAIMTGRFLLMPLILFSFVKLASRIFPGTFPLVSDQTLIFILLLESFMPSAQNSTVIFQLQGKPEAAANIAKILMMVYLLGMAPISFWLSKALTQTGLFKFLG